MVQVLIYVRGDHSIEEYCFFSRELSPVLIDYQEVGLTLLYDTQTKHIHLCLIKLDTNTSNNNLASNESDRQNPPSDGNETSAHTTSQDQRRTNDNEISGNSNSDYQVPTNVIKLSFSDIVPVKEATLLLDAHVISCVCCEMKRSRIFRRRFLKYVARTCGFKSFIVPNTVTVSHVSEFFDSVVLVPYVVKLCLLYPRQKIDYAWSYRISSQITKWLMLDSAMNWLSTLGGGYSSLGDYFQHHAEEAGRISIKQLKLATEMGDPLMAARCKLFFAQSLLQRGYIKETRHIVRSQGYFCKSLLVSDDKLTAMYKSLRWRLKHTTSNGVW